MSERERRGVAGRNHGMLPQRGLAAALVAFDLDQNSRRMCSYGWAANPTWRRSQVNMQSN
jgi:hypothetical protein